MNLMLRSHQAKANTRMRFFSLIFDVAWCEQLHGKQCNLFVRDVTFAFVFAWCEPILSLSLG